MYKLLFQKSNLIICHTSQRQISCANIIDGKKNCYKSSLKVNFSHPKVCKIFTCCNNTYVEYSIFILEVCHTTIEYRKFFFQIFKNLSTYLCVQFWPCVDRIPPTTQGCIRIMFGTYACWLLVLCETIENNYLMYYA